jgi:hypothetical protein
MRFACRSSAGMTEQQVFLILSFWIAAVFLMAQQ